MMATSKRRLSFLDSTLKELFAVSGNQCAFPGCSHPVIDELGQVVAQVAHIVGVEPLSPRYDATWTPEQLRESRNLIILCNAHHIATNDVKMYDVPKLVDMKARHEARFSSLVSGLQNAVEDRTAGVRYRQPENLQRFAVTAGLKEGHEFLVNAAAQIPAALERLRVTPPELRSLLAMILEHGYDGGTGESWSIDFTRLALLNNLEERTYINYINTLIDMGYVYVDHEDGNDSYIGTHSQVVTRATMLGVDSTVPAIISTMMDVGGIPAHQILVKLDWRFLQG
ncbi:hypothetical protein [Blastococcus sp. SYSU DS0619]